MPTKHKRKREDDKSNFDLPPSSKAKPLPVIAPTKDFLTPRKRQKLNDGKSNRKKSTKNDSNDMPKTFARLMAWHKEGKKIGGGLDDGSKPAKKSKKKQQSSETATAETATKSDPPSTNSTIPKIQPGETLTDFAIRVDQSLPLTSLAKSNINPNTSLPADLLAKEKKSKHLTKHNKRLARMQAEWRNTEAKLNAKEEEEAEQNEEKLAEEKLLWDGVRMTGKKGKKRLVEDDDPWKVLEKKRREEDGRRERGAVIGLTAKDQAQAPPVLGAVKNIFKERAVAAPARTSESSGFAERNGLSRPTRKGGYSQVAEQAKRQHIQGVLRRAQDHRHGIPV
ncbi:hypothetical protein LTS08_006528 [Lithohypha guttulata]|uniref:Uncharacterized protein n=1 Tax=Lithohypha guttulata TaxID=1690604 RepID=A0AAN7Y6W6_9EURO|nr:hypothetical protein LTR05_005175 [Lithohypha guttulata]KAK5098395.1 hypothetical protein LTS08_006528 [Lithohypha guttulata]